MKKLFFISAFLLTVTACDYREYPQEEEWKEEFQDIQQEYEQEDITKEEAVN